MITQNQRKFLVNHIVDHMTQFIIEDNGVPLPEALRMVYNSKVYQLLQNTNGELYIQSPSYVYELLKQESSANCTN